MLGSRHNQLDQARCCSFSTIVISKNLAQPGIEPEGDAHKPLTLCQLGYQILFQFHTRKNESSTVHDVKTFQKPEPFYLKNGKKPTMDITMKTGPKEEMKLFIAPISKLTLGQQFWLVASNPSYNSLSVALTFGSVRDSSLPI